MWRLKNCLDLPNVCVNHGFLAFLFCLHLLNCNNQICFVQNVIKYQLVLWKKSRTSGHWVILLGQFKVYVNTKNILITCSTVVLQCYRWQTIPMKQGKIRLSVTLYSFGEHYQLGVINYVSDASSDANFGWIWLGVEFPANVWLFVVSLFSFRLPEQNPWVDLHTQGLKTCEIS